jgi:uncharacterized tellurite resistance protein B-like protein
MEFSNAQALYFLAFRIGAADGEEFSTLELTTVARQSPSFRAYALEALEDHSALLGLIRGGTLNEQSALEKIKNGCSQEEILDFLADCVAIVAADGELHGAELETYQRYANFLEIDGTDGIARYSSRNNA